MPEERTERSSIVDAIRSYLEARPEILFAYLHGSFEEGGPYRDVDVAVWLDPARASSGAWYQYALNLSLALQTAVKETVDVQVLNGAPLAVRYHALRGKAILVRDWDLLDDVRARTWDDYFDFLPFARQYLREALSA